MEKVSGAAWDMSLDRIYYLGLGSQRYPLPFQVHSRHLWDRSPRASILCGFQKIREQFDDGWEMHEVHARACRVVDRQIIFSKKSFRQKKLTPSIERDFVSPPFFAHSATGT